MRVLIVEDEADLLSALEKTLREEGYAVDAALDGAEGLFKAQSWEYDAVILDLMLPKLSGWEFLAHLRRTHTTPVLILTARDTVSDRVKGLDAGADDYLVKPFALSELLARTRALIRRSAGQATSVLEVGDVLIDMATHTVRKEGESVPLTAREYALLELLTLNAGRVVTKTQIYEHLFDETEDSLSNLVEVHVSNLRKKLGRDFIATRRGQGYIVDV